LGSAFGTVRPGKSRSSPLLRGLNPPWIMVMSRQSTFTKDSREGEGTTESEIGASVAAIDQ